VSVLVRSCERAWRRGPGVERLAPEPWDLRLGKSRVQVAGPRPEVVEQQTTVPADPWLLAEGARVLSFDAHAVVLVAGAVDHEPGEPDGCERVERLGRREPHQRALP